MHTPLKKGLLLALLGAAIFQNSATADRVAPPLDGKLVSSKGKETTLASLYKSQHLVVVFYRGHW